MAKKKLLHIQLLPLLSGVQNMMLSLLAGLDQDKFEVYVISKPGGPLEEVVKSAGYNYLPLSCLRRNISIYDIAALLKLYKIIRNNKFEIVHTHSSKTGFLGRIAAKLAGCPLVVHTVHGFAIHEHQSGIVNIIYGAMEYIAGKFCDRVVFVNNFEREMAVRKGILKAEKVITIYNGIAVEEFLAKNPATYLCERDYREEPFIIGSVLRFTAQKNILNTIRAAIAVCRHNSLIRFVFIGDGEDFLICKKLVEQENLNARILLTGWQSEINKLLLKMDVFLLYSRWEGLSISILEAMASGLPIVASDIKGNNELVDESNGILIDIDRKSKLVKVLSELPERRQELMVWSRNSRQKVEHIYNYERFIAQYREIYGA